MQQQESTSRGHWYIPPAPFIISAAAGLHFFHVLSSGKAAKFSYCSCQCNHKVLREGNPEDKAHHQHASHYAFFSSKKCNSRCNFGQLCKQPTAAAREGTTLSFNRPSSIAMTHPRILASVRPAMMTRRLKISDTQSEVLKLISILNKNEKIEKIRATVFFSQKNQTMCFFVQNYSFWILILPASKQVWMEVRDSDARHQALVTIDPHSPFPRYAWGRIQSAGHHPWSDSKNKEVERKGRILPTIEGVDVFLFMESIER